MNAGRRQNDSTNFTRWLGLMALMTVITLHTAFAIGISISASAQATCGTEFSHVLTVEWNVSEAKGAVEVRITVTLPDGTTQTSTQNVAQGQVSFDLPLPGGGEVFVQVNAQSQGNSAAASARASLEPCGEGQDGAQTPESSDAEIVACIAQRAGLGEADAEDPLGLMRLDALTSGGPATTATVVTGPSQINQHLTVRLIGTGQLVNGPPEMPFEPNLRSQVTTATKDEPPAATAQFRQASFRAFNLDTQLEYEVTVAQPLLDAVHSCREERNLTNATEGVDDPDAVESGQRLSLSALVGFKLAGWSNGNDSRIVRAPTTAWPSRAISHFGYGSEDSGCSGTLIGPRHIVTAAHCINQEGTSNWYMITITPGKDGMGSQPFGTSAISPCPCPSGTGFRWYFTPSPWRDPDTDNVRQWDWGVIVIPNRLGDQTGWMGYVARPGSELENVYNYNRGYPSCNSSFAERPAGCQTARLYGDLNPCNIGGYSYEGPDGWNRLISVSCDSSRGHSGSANYHYFFDQALNKYVPVVSMMMVSHTCLTCSGSDDYPNWARRITPADLETISFFRQWKP